MATNRPNVIGGTIFVGDSTELAALDSTGLPPGTQVWNADVGAYFALTVSTASLVTDEVVAVLGITGYRWIIVTIEIAAGSITNADLADMAAHTWKIRKTNSTGAPEDASTTEATALLNAATTSLQGAMSAADKTKLDSLPSSTAGVRQTVTLTAAPSITFTGLNGDADGGYKIRGTLRTTAAAPLIVLQFNGATPTASGSSGSWSQDANTTCVGIQLNAVLVVGSNVTSEASDISFIIEVSSKQGEVGQFKCQAFSERASGTKCICYATAGKFNMGANITSVSIADNSGTSTLDVGSYAVLSKMGVTA